MARESPCWLQQPTAWDPSLTPHISLHRVLVFGNCPPWVTMLGTWNPNGHRDPLSHPPVYPAFSHCEASGCLPAQCLVDLCF